MGPDLDDFGDEICGQDCAVAMKFKEIPFLEYFVAGTVVLGKPERLQVWSCGLYPHGCQECHLKQRWNRGTS